MKTTRQFWAWAFVLVLLSGCPKPAEEPFPRPGPVPLQSLSQMQAYLAGEDAWARAEDDFTQYWRFTDDDLFVVWIEGQSRADLHTILSPTIPKGTKRLEGRWQATMNELRFFDNRSSAGQAVTEITVPLRWLDGKLHIEIGGFQYSCTKQQPPESGSNAAASSAPPGKLFGQKYVPPDVMFVSAVFPRRTLSRPELAGAPVEQVLQKFGHLDRPVEMPVPTRFLADLSVPLKDVEQAICVVTGIRTAGDASSAEEERDDELPHTGRAEEHAGPDAERDSWLYGPLMEAYVVRLTVAVPREAAVGLLFRPQEIVLGGKTYFGQGKDTGAVAVHFPDERTMIVGEERVVRQMLASADRPSALAAALDQVDRDADIQGAIDVAAVRDRLKRRTETDPESKDAVDDPIVATFSVRLDPRPCAKVVVRAKDPEAGAEIVELLRNGIAAAREQLAAMLPPHAEPQVHEFRTLARDLFARGLKSLKVERVENRVEVTLGDFAPLTDLTALLKLFSATTLRDAVVPLPAVPLFDEDATATTIRRLIPAAAGCRAEILCTIARSESTPKPWDVMKDIALSVIVLNYRIPPPGMYQAHADEFRFDTTIPKPSELARELLRERHLGYYSMIHLDRITDFTCEVDGDTAKGSVSFKVPRLYEGEIQYLAERVEGFWQIKELHLPIHRWRFVRTEDGQWKWFNMFGDVGDLVRRAGPVSPRWPGQQSVSGKITRDGKPLTEATIEFFHNVDVLFQGSAFVQDGSYRTKLPTGSYHVVILRSKPDVPKKYRTPDRSGLMVEVREGENTIDFELSTE
ncbi:MAG: hypothetical protein H8E44_09930 [Planctomycetes bacterium]|nr:hypothetical protein [Planctomycetota bacterium]MBL7041967.1 hypothetical protein [Pirellulaceae bacterium]